MKKVTVYSREVTKRTGFRAYPFKSVREVTIVTDGKEVSNHNEDINNPRLKKPFVVVFDSRRKSDLEAFIKSLGRTDADKFLKANLQELAR